MAQDDKKSFITSLLSSLGIVKPEQESDVDENSSKFPIGSMNHQGAQFERHEWVKLVEPIRTGPNQATNAIPTPEELKTSMLGVSRSIAKHTKTNDSFFDLSPELTNATRIWVSTILSPNDMQTGSINIVCEDEQLDESKRSEVSKVVTDYFNDQVKLGNKLSEWIKEFMFSSGAKPVLVLPRAELRNLYGMSVSNENLSFGTSAEFDKLFNPEYASELQPQLESLGFDVESLAAIDSSNKKSLLDNIVNQSKMWVKAVVFDEKTGTPQTKISFNIDDIQKGTRQNYNRNIRERNNWFKTLFDNDASVSKGYAVGTNTNIKDTDVKTHDEPILVELPSESVVPVYVSGSVSQHIGYFVLLDETGAPLQPVDDSNVTARTMTSSLMQRTQATTSGGWGNMSMWMHDKMSSQEKFQRMSAAFSVAVKQMMLSSLKKNNIVSVDIGSYHAVSNCMLFHLLGHNKVSLVYVPEPMMAYYCFDYRKDGTGKAITEDSEYILALRSTLLIAYVMGAIQDAIQHRTITVDMDPKNIEVERIMTTIRESFMQKQELPFSNNPSAISRDIAKKSISVIPKNLKGLEGSLAMEKESKNNTGGRVDTELIDRFTTMGVSNWGIPHNLFNQTSEAEFARSVASSNLMFSNNTRMYQGKLEPNNTKLIQNYTALSSNLKNAIREILSHSSTEGDKNLNEDGTVKSTSGDETNTPGDANAANSETQQNEELYRIILSLRLVLPQPNMVVGKAHYEEINAFKGALTEICDILFSTDQFSANNSELNEAVTQIKAIVQATMMRRFIDTLGIDVFDVPDIEEAIRGNDTVLSDQLKALFNFKHKIISEIQVSKESVKSQSADSSQPASLF